MKKLSFAAKFFIGAVILTGIGLFAKEMLHWESPDMLRFLGTMAVAAVAARLRVSLPGITGSMSVNLPFILLAMIELSMAEAIAIACVSSLVQCLFPESGKRNPVQMLFNVCNMAMAVWIAGFVFENTAHGFTFSVSVAAVVFLIGNTVPVATIISITENKNVVSIWRQIVRLTFPYYVLSAGIASMVKTADRMVGWQIPVLLLAVMYMIYHSYANYFRGVLASRLQAGQSFAAASAAYD